MPFHSLAFIFLFVPAAVGGYFAFNHWRRARAAKVWLILASLFFYGCWNPVYVPLLLFSATVNYGVGLRVRAVPGEEKNRERRCFLILGLIFNIALLGYFKYANFFIANLDGLFDAGLPALNVIFPIGISFFTLQQIAFLMDSFEGIAEEKSFLDYLVFVSFFPYLTVGPISHRRDVLPLLGSEGNESSRIDYRNMTAGLFLFSIGLFKKVICAGFLDAWVSEAYSSPGFGFTDSWIASLSYTLQLYFDFSGYSDMALGLGLFFNVHLPLNFNSPLKAWNIVEFWRRWHMSLANFMRTYVFAALLRARARVTFGFSLWASFVTMLIMGIWHGAGWNYVLFGVMHGLAVVIYSLWMKAKIKLPKPLGWFLLFNFINLSLVPVRAGDLHDTFRLMKGMIGLNGFALARKAGPILAAAPDDTFLSAPPEQIAALFCLIAVVVFAKNSVEMVKSFKPDAENLLIVFFLFMISVLNIGHANEFIYFQF